VTKSVDDLCLVTSLGVSTVPLISGVQSSVSDSTVILVKSALVKVTSDQAYQECVARVQNSDRTRVVSEHFALLDCGFLRVAEGPA
jgi:hypothetical protein